MALYRYRAVAADGEIAEGEMEAQDRDEVVRRLRAGNMVPIRADDAGATGTAVRRVRRRRAGGRQAALLVRELAAMVGAGLAVDRALAVATELTERELARPAARLLEKVRGGAALSEAMAAETGLFSGFHVAVVRAGEAGGELGRALARLAGYMERSRAAAEQVGAALIYPVILVVFAGLTAVFLMTWVVPQFADMFRQAGRDLPGGLAGLVGAGTVLRDWGWLLALALLAAGLGLPRLLARDAVRLAVDRRTLRLPVAGRLVAMVEGERQARALAALVGAGVPLHRACELAAQAAGNRAVAERMEALARDVREGRGFARPFAATGLLPPAPAALVRVGEETGRLAPMLEEAADLLARDCELAVRRLVAWAVPAITGALGLMVAGMVLALLTAVTSLYELAG